MTKPSEDFPLTVEFLIYGIMTIGNGLCTSNSSKGDAMPTISKEIIIQANKGATKPFLRILFVFSLFGSGVIVYSIYVMFTEGNTVFGACVLSCGLLYLLFKIWRHFYKEIIRRTVIIKKVEDNLFFGDIQRSMNGYKRLNIKIE
jgi:hypothetical protein